MTATTAADAAYIVAALLFIRALAGLSQHESAVQSCRKAVQLTEELVTAHPGVASYQLLQHNHENGYDFPMVYAEVYIPKVAEGLVIRAGRYISVPDIEAQLAPNNYMYSHSMTYSYDNYTNTGVIASLQATKNWMIQAGVSAGTETVPWNTKDPGTQPSFTACVRCFSRVLSMNC